MYHRNPMIAPTIAPQMIATSYWRSRNAMAVYTSKAIAPAPAASPSRPSVRFTALVVPTITSNKKRLKSEIPTTPGPRARLRSKPGTTTVCVTPT